MSGGIKVYLKHLVCRHLKLPRFISADETAHLLSDAVLFGNGFTVMVPGLTWCHAEGM